MIKLNQNPHRLTKSDDYIQPSSPLIQPTPHVGEQPQHENPEEYQILQQQQNSAEQQANLSREVQRPDVPKAGSPDDSEVAEKFLHDMLDMHRQQQQQSYEMFQLQQTRGYQLQQLLGQHQQWALSTMLPNVKVPTYGGVPFEYCHFIQSFENLIETKTTSNNTCLYYLVQYTSGDVQELMRSCLSMNPEEGYNRARKLLKQHYGQSYRIATAYLDPIAKTPNQT